MRKYKCFPAQVPLTSIFCKPYASVVSTPPAPPPGDVASFLEVAMRTYRSVSWAYAPAGLLSLVLLAGGGAPAAAQSAQGQQAAIAGRVTAQESGAPLPESRVLVVGTSIFTSTNAEGRYTLRNVPAGPVTLRVLRVGYNEQKRAVTAVSGQTQTVDFPLERAIVQLQEVVTTATGDQRRVELGHTVSTIDAVKKMEEAPIKNMGDLLVAKAPGVQVLPANMTGGGSRVRIRGTSSISLSNDPIYIIDGIRMTSGSGSGGTNIGSAIGVGGTTPNRVNDIDPDQIENIEVVKGPSAATLYGTDAANGVIVITTKKGRAGRPQWTLSGDYGTIRDDNQYPTMHAILGHAPGSATARKCLLKELSAKTCLMDSTTSVNVFETPDITPIKPGSRGQVVGQLQGGTEAVRYFVSGGYEREYGPLGMPDFDRARFAQSKVDVLKEWDRPSALSQGSYRANLNAAVTPTLDLGVQAGFTNLSQRLPQVDNNVNSFWYNGTVGPGFSGAGPGYTGTGSLGQTLRGYASYTPGDIFQFYTNQDIQRFIGGTNANWRPTSWLQNRAEVGVDLTERDDFSLCRLGQCSDFGTNRQGRATDARANIRNFTANLGSTATWQARPWLNLKTTAGVQYVNFRFYSNSARGEQLPPGAETPAAGTIPNVGSGTTLQKTLGLFIEESFAVRDRLFATAAVRTDQNSAFGTNFQRVYYPKGSLSWVISDEEFFPRPDWLDQFRLRTAVGSSGVQPGPNDADRTFQVTTTNIATTDVAGLRSNQLGNPDIKPERSTEFEAGFESRFFGSRVSFDYTFYRKQTKDALVQMVIAPSAGATVTSNLTNLAAVRNWGHEALLNAQLVATRLATWDLTVSASHNSNRLISLGTDASGKPIPTIGTGTNRQAEGYPLNSTWTRRFTYDDANDDGLITPSEVVVDTGFTYLGYSQPRLELSITNGVGLFRDRVRLSALVDHKSGYYVQNNEQSFLCQQSTSCRGTSSLDATLWEQARAIAIRDGTPQTPHGYFEKPDFWRVREVSATYTVSDQLAQRYLRMRGASVSLAARNVKVFTDWTGVDPEQNYSQGDTQSTLLTAGPPRYYTARVNLRF
jgi:TonB-linked SusC/RagA family outer membrane protein